MVKDYEVMGYTWEGDTYCVNCATDLMKDEMVGSPIFAGSEWDYQPTCSDCHEEIEVQVIEYKKPEEDFSEKDCYGHYIAKEDKDRECVDCQGIADCLAKSKIIDYKTRDQINAMHQILQIKKLLEEKNGLTLTVLQIGDINERAELLKALKDPDKTVEFEWKVTYSMHYFYPSDCGIIESIESNTNLGDFDSPTIEWTPVWQVV